MSDEHQDSPKEVPKLEVREIGTAGHRVKLEFHSGGFFATLICPESGCDSGECAFCGADMSDPSSKRCRDCEETNPGECWLKSWFDNNDPCDLLHGEVELPITASWDGDHPDVRLATR